MKLKLKNVRQHDDFEVELPDVGIVMLQGPSGCGKTTLMASIKAALLGKEPDMAPWGSSKWEVEFGFKDLWIKRTGGPSTLTVKIGEEEFKDDVAQSEIHKWLGMNSTEFLACSYVQQGQKGSLLDLPPAQQQKLVEDLAASGANVEKIREKIADGLKTKKEELDKAQAAHDQAFKEEEEYAAMLVLPTSPTPKTPVEKYKSSEQLEVEYNGVISECTEKIRELDEKLESPYYENVVYFANRQKQFREGYAAAQDSINDQKRALEEAEKPWQEKSLEDMRTEASLLDKKLDWFENRKALMDIAKKIFEFDEAAKTAGIPLIEYMDNTIAELQGREKEILKECALKQNELDGLNKAPKTQNCPKCEADLVVVDGTIYASEDDPKDVQERREAVIKELQALSSEETNISHDIHRYKELRESASKAKARLGDDPMPEIKTKPETKERAGANIAYMKAQQALESKIAQLQSNISSEEAQLKKEEVELKALETRLKEYGEMPDQRELKAEKEKFREQRDEAKEKLEQIKPILDEYREFQQQQREYEIKKKNYDEMFERAKAKRDEAAATWRQLKAAEDKYAAYVRLKEKSDFAAVEANELIVYQINDNSAKFIDRLFADDGTVVKINNVSTVGKGSKAEERAKFSTEVWHKGLKAKRKGFSGGEKSRSCLAFQLGLSDMYNSPILMVDEGFSGLDEDLKTLCLEVLKEVSEDRLILVVEHGAPESFFDEVVTVA